MARRKNTAQTLMGNWEFYGIKLAVLYTNTWGLGEQISHIAEVISDSYL